MYTTSTNNQGSTITAEELIAQMQDAVARLGPPLPEIRPSAFVPPGHFIKIPNCSPLFFEHARPPNDIMFVSPADYQIYLQSLGDK